MSSTAGSPGWEDLALLAATVSLVVAGAVFPAGRLPAAKACASLGSALT